MGKRFLRSIAIANEDLPASATIQPRDLPVNPLSFLLLRLQITRVNPTASLLYSAIDDVITQITNVTIRHNGENIISGSLRDLMVLNMVYQRAMPGWSLLNNDSGSIASLVFPICFGKRMYDPMSGFPATRRGALQFLLTAGADGAAYSDVNLSVEAVELIEETPSEYFKATTLAATSVAGQFDMVLPIGNPLRGILMFDTGLGGSTDEVLSWGQVRLLKDNVEQMYGVSDFEVMASELHSQMGCMVGWPGHVHQRNAAGAGLENTDDAEQLVNSGYQGYAFMDFDPLRDGYYELETAGASNIVLRGVGDEATAIRALPLERVMVK